jgi:hypothetical protein
MVPSSGENQTEGIRDRRNDPTVDAVTLGILTQLREHILDLMQEGERAGLTADVDTFHVPHGIGCSCKVRGGTSIVAHFGNLVTPEGIASIWIWNSADEQNPIGKPIAGRFRYGIESTGEKTKERQVDLLKFIKDWIETGKPGMWK